MACKLCLASAPLRESHIFPEFLYRISYDATHTLEVHTVADGEAFTIIQKGLREPLLCADCEQKVGRWERHASQVLFHDGAGTWSQVGDELQRSGVDYRKFKLFALSLIWRASVSTQRPFADVALGPLEEKVRLLLLNEDPGPHYLYPCFLRVFVEEPVMAQMTIITPYRQKVASHRGYKALFGGILWTWVMSGHAGPINTAVGIIKEDGVLPLLLSSHGQEREFFAKIVSRLPPEFFDDET